jgi:hypothetical protein
VGDMTGRFVGAFLATVTVAALIGAVLGCATAFLLLWMLGKI